jgi:hypothetical protein
MDEEPRKSREEQDGPPLPLPADIGRMLRTCSAVLPPAELRCMNYALAATWLAGRTEAALVADEFVQIGMTESYARKCLGRLHRNGVMEKRPQQDEYGRDRANVFVPNAAWDGTWDPDAPDPDDTEEKATPGRPSRSRPKKNENIDQGHSTRNGGRVQLATPYPAINCAPGSGDPNDGMTTGNLALRVAA